jgi:hypothetical protein
MQYSKLITLVLAAVAPTTILAAPTAHAHAAPIEGATFKPVSLMKSALSHPIESTADTNITLSETALVECSAVMTSDAIRGIRMVLALSGGAARKETSRAVLVFGTEI